MIMKKSFSLKGKQTIRTMFLCALLIYLQSTVNPCIPNTNKD